MSRRLFNSDAYGWNLSGVQITDIEKIFDYVVDDANLIQDKEIIAIK